MNQTQLAEALGMSRQQLYRLKRRGMPVDSVESALSWRSKHLDPAWMSPEETKASSKAKDIEEIDYHSSKALREHFAAKKEELEFKRMDNELMVAEDAHSAVAALMVALRSGLESMGSVLAPQLAASPDEGMCRRLVDDRVRSALTECARKLESLGKPRK